MSVEHSKHIKRKKKVAQVPVKESKFLDKLIFLAVIFGPLMTLPQIYSIWATGSTDVSVISWSAYTVTSIIWLAYGLYHREKAIIASSVIWLSLDLIIVVGILVAS